ncbi:MAG TPA: FAD-dependent oxidoreductase [Ktedonobacteraceae bacterium]|nr:FAD-dependent oxidoreductase [Ktedonobacteraceae bacterium]
MQHIRRIPILIVGGGIGGLTTALALSRKGFPVHLIEKAHEFGEIGAGIQIAPNGSRMLDAIGILGQLHTYAVYPRRLILVDALSGETLTALDYGEAFQRAYTYPYLVMHRNDLLTLLLHACQESDTITLETNREVITVEDLGDGARVICADGTTYECNALIAADGLWSTVRQYVLGDGDPVCVEFVAYRGAIPMEEVIETAGLDTIRYWIGPNLHLIQYPLRRGELYNQVAVFKSERYRADSDDWGTEDELEQHFAKTHESVQRALTRVKRDRRWPLYDRPPTDNWTRHHITLLGDAAHPMLQHIAQGACQAIEDAVYLADAMSSQQGDVKSAFRLYQQERIPRTARVQRSARLFGDIIHSDGLTALLRNVLFSQRTPDDLTYTDWFYAYQPGKKEASNEH